MNAGERLRQLAGGGGSAAALLLALGSGTNAGAALLDYSGLATGSAAQHLLAEHQPVELSGSGVANLSPAIRRRDDEEILLCLIL